MKSQQKVYLIAEAQRDALISYLQERPYKEVANGIQFLASAPTAMLNITVEDGVVASASLSPAETKSEKMFDSKKVSDSEEASSQEMPEPEQTENLVDVQ